MRTGVVNRQADRTGKGKQWSPDPPETPGELGKLRANAGRGVTTSSHLRNPSSHPECTTSDFLNECGRKPCNTGSGRGKSSYMDNSRADLAYESPASPSVPTLGNSSDFDQNSAAYQRNSEAFVGPCKRRVRRGRTTSHKRRRLRPPLSGEESDWLPELEAASETESNHSECAPERNCHRRQDETEHDLLSLHQQRNSMQKELLHHDHLLLQCGLLLDPDNSAIHGSMPHRQSDTMCEFGSDTSPDLCMFQDHLMVHQQAPQDIRLHSEPDDTLGQCSSSGGDASAQRLENATLNDYDMCEVSVEWHLPQLPETQERPADLVPIRRVFGINAGMTLFNLHRIICISLGLDEDRMCQLNHVWILPNNTTYGGGPLTKSRSTGQGISACRLKVTTDRAVEYRHSIGCFLDEDDHVIPKPESVLIYVLGCVQMQVPRCVADGSYGAAPGRDVNWNCPDDVSRHVPTLEIDVHKINLAFIETRFSKNTSLSRRTKMIRADGIDSCVLQCYSESIHDFWRDPGRVRQLAIRVSRQTLQQARRRSLDGPRQQQMLQRKKELLALPSTRCCMDAEGLELIRPGSLQLQCTSTSEPAECDTGNDVVSALLGSSIYTEGGQHGVPDNHLLILQGSENMNLMQLRPEAAWASGEATGTENINRDSHISFSNAATDSCRDLFHFPWEYNALGVQQLQQLQQLELASQCDQAFIPPVQFPDQSNSVLSQLQQQSNTNLGNRDTTQQGDFLQNPTEDFTANPVSHQGFSCPRHDGGAPTSVASVIPNSASGSSSRWQGAPNGVKGEHIPSTDFQTSYSQEGILKYGLGSVIENWNFPDDQCLSMNNSSFLTSRTENQQPTTQRPDRTVEGPEREGSVNSAVLEAFKYLHADTWPRPTHGMWQQHQRRTETTFLPPVSKQLMSPPNGAQALSSIRSAA